MTSARASARRSADRSHTVKRVMVLEFSVRHVAMSRSQGAHPESPLKPGLNVKACFEAKGSSWYACAPLTNYFLIACTYSLMNVVFDSRIPITKILTSRPAAPRARPHRPHRRRRRHRAAGRQPATRCRQPRHRPITGHCHGRCAAASRPSRRRQSTNAAAPSSSHGLRKLTPRQVRMPLAVALASAALVMVSWKLRGDSQVANSRVDFCRSFRIAVQTGASTLAALAVRSCVLHTTARLC